MAKLTKAQEEALRKAGFTLFKGAASGKPHTYRSPARTGEDGIKRRVEMMVFTQGQTKPIIYVMRNMGGETWQPQGNPREPSLEAATRTAIQLAGELA